MNAEMEHCIQVGRCRFEQQVESKVEENVDEQEKEEVDVNCLVEVEETVGGKDAGFAEDVGKGEEDGKGGKAAHPGLVDNVEVGKHTVEKS